jgi:DNA-binding XRE family transcriptional regulator
MENIRTFRVLKKMSQWELAQTAGIVQSKISLFERGYGKM